MKIPMVNPSTGDVAHVNPRYAAVLERQDPPWKRGEVDVDEAVAAGEDVPVAPSRNASKGDWVAHAVSQGVAAEEAEASTRDELADRFGA